MFNKKIIIQIARIAVVNVLYVLTMVLENTKVY